ncbi:MAG TPA: hypothetical protein VN602_06505 [Gemmatimonadaceae bacterium]|nr:hypothetical protein [Gemmatimonadaceae bacterium]
MPFRTVTVDGAAWRVQPTGYVTANTKDEFALIFARGTGAERETRVVRYSPVGARWREPSFAALSDDDLRRLFAQSQPSATSPEAFYAR